MGCTFEISVVPFHDTAGALLGSIHLASGISERKRKEEEQNQLQPQAFLGINQCIGSSKRLFEAAAKNTIPPALLEEVARNIEERHRGRIFIDTSEGTGTTFILRLPT